MIETLDPRGESDLFEEKVQGDEQGCRHFVRGRGQDGVGLQSDQERLNQESALQGAGGGQWSEDFHLIRCNAQFFLEFAQGGGERRGVIGIGPSAREGDLSRVMRDGERAPDEKQLPSLVAQNDGDDHGCQLLGGIGEPGSECLPGWPDFFIKTGNQRFRCQGGETGTINRSDHAVIRSTCRAQHRDRLPDRFAQGQGELRNAFAKGVGCPDFMSGLGCGASDRQGRQRRYRLGGGTGERFIAWQPPFGHQLFGGEFAVGVQTFFDGRRFFVIVEDFADIALGFGQGRDALKPFDHFGSSVVGCQGMGDFGELFEHSAEIAGATAQVLFGVVDVFDPEDFGGFRHELHQAHSAIRRDGLVVEVRLGGDDGAQQVGIEIFLNGDLGDQPVERGVGLRRCAPDRDDDRCQEYSGQWIRDPKA